MKRKVLLIIIDGVPYRNWRTLFGNLEGWVANKQAQVFQMRACMPSMSGPCYASIHTGAVPQEHGILSNERRFRVTMPDLFSCISAAGGRTGAVAHSYWSEFFNRYPFDPVRDLEYDDPSGPVHHGRFHTMDGYGHANQMTPADSDLFATLTMLTERFSLDYGMLHTCTLDSMGHRFGHECTEMDHACAFLDGQLAAYLPRWLANGYEVIVTADHGQTDRGHHGGSTEEMRDFALYYFGSVRGLSKGPVLDQIQLAPTILSLMDIPIPPTMRGEVFLSERG